MMMLHHAKLSNQRPIRLYEADDIALKTLHKETHEHCGLAITELIRECIRVGRPVLEKELHNAIKKAS